MGPWSIIEQPWVGYLTIGSCSDLLRAQQLAIARPAGPRFHPEVRSHGDKITFGEMRESGVRGLLIYCGDYHCSHSITLSADRWPDQVRLSDLEPRFVCQACGIKAASIDHRLVELTGVSLCERAL